MLHIWFFFLKEETERTGLNDGGGGIDFCVVFIIVFFGLASSIGRPVGVCVQNYNNSKNYWLTNFSTLYNGQLLIKLLVYTHNFNIIFCASNWKWVQHDTWEKYFYRWIIAGFMLALAADLNIFLRRRRKFQSQSIHMV